ncbi:hypothetical protein [Pantoea sp.]|uniref:hypothetical protein n=1 Tax=Pantoea sp. TaxID=69393 RepID=UPI00289A4CA6|nr:hypothetical protein [Pantoea sp.]
MEKGSFFLSLCRDSPFRQKPKSIQLDQVHLTINFGHRNNCQLKYQSHVTEINLPFGESEIQTTKKHPAGCFFYRFQNFSLTAAALFL